MKADIRLNKLNKVITLSLLDIDQYKLIFNDSPRRIDMLRNTADSFFYFYKEYFWRRMFIDVSRITDAPGIGKNKNLTISLYEELAQNLKLDEYDIIVKNNNEVRKLVKRFRRIRNKITAHMDMDYATGKKKFDSDPDGLIKVEMIYNILKENNKIFQNVYEDLLPIGYEIGPTGDAQDLMRYLWKGYTAEKQ